MRRNIILSLILCEWIILKYFLVVSEELNPEKNKYSHGGIMIIAIRTLEID